jgi:hypothetical protein
MNVLLPNLIEALREELQQYGEMLARLDQQQHLVMRRQTDDLFRSVSEVNGQADVISGARKRRDRCQRDAALKLNLPENAGFREIIPLLSPDYRPLLEALVQENNELLVRVQQRARQNHLLLSHCVELMQRLINSILPTVTPTMYDDVGRLPASVLPQHSLYEAVG